VNTLVARRSSRLFTYVRARLRFLRVTDRILEPFSDSVRPARARDRSKRHENGFRTKGEFVLPIRPFMRSKIVGPFDYLVLGSRSFPSSFRNGPMIPVSSVRTTRAVREQNKNACAARKDRFSFFKQNFLCFFFRLLFSKYACASGTYDVRTCQSYVLLFLFA